MSGTGSVDPQIRVEMMQIKIIDKFFSAEAGSSFHKLFLGYFLSQMFA